MSASTLVVLVYDVGNDRRRRKLHALLKQYGVPVQESAFEARLTPSERGRLLERAAKLLVENVDRFVMYTVPKAHEQNIAVIGTPRPPIEAKTFFIV
jgi:CRISPR-associated protein Cas2